MQGSVLEQSYPHKVPDIGKTLPPVLFKSMRWTDTILSEEEWRDLWGVYKEIQCERQHTNMCTYEERMHTHM